MIKNLGYKLAILGCAASCLASVAQAKVGTVDQHDNGFDGNSDQPHEFDDVVFVGLNDDKLFPDVACVPFDAPWLREGRAVTFILNNTEPAPFRLFDIKMSTFADDNSDVGFTFSTAPTAFPEPRNCLSPPCPFPNFCGVDPETHYGQGYIYAYEQCSLTVEFTPPLCHTTGQHGQPVPMSANIHKLLSIGVGSQEDLLLLEAQSEVNVIGSGNDFAVLGYNQAPVNQGNGNSQLFGNLGVVNSHGGFTPTPNADGFTLPNSATAFDSQNNPVVAGAEADFLAAWLTLEFDDEFDNNCIPYGNMNNANRLTSGSYCLFNAYVAPDHTITPIDVTLDGNVTLTGPGNFYFNMDNSHECILTAADPATGAPAVTRMCNLRVGPNFNIIYDADQNGDRPGPQNVFWILNGTEVPTDDATPIDPPLVLGSTDFNHIYLANGSRLDGSILGGAGGPNGEPSYCNIGEGLGAPFGNNIIAEYTTGDRGVNVNGSIWSRCGQILLAGTTVWPAQ